MSAGPLLDFVIEHIGPIYTPYGRLSLTGIPTEKAN
jgi:hypothetical protein